MNMAATVTHGFGVPDDVAPHQFVVVIPKALHEPVEIWEDFGAKRLDRLDNKVKRAVVPRDAWRGVVEDATRYLNQRLRKNKIKVSKFRLGENRVERILGRELCVLAWSVERASADAAKIAGRRWSSYRPEELWWLYQQIERDAGTWDALDVGWRRAIRDALTNAGSLDDHSINSAA